MEASKCIKINKTRTHVNKQLELKVRQAGSKRIRSDLEAYAEHNQPGTNDRNAH